MNVMTTQTLVRSNSDECRDNPDSSESNSDECNDNPDSSESNSDECNDNPCRQ